MKFTHFHLVSLIILLAFLIRFFPISFPTFTSDEARIAFRGYTLTATGKDELGRSFPLIFNSLKDYQLPVVSYLVAGGELIFGKSEFGARIPFLAIGTVLVLLTYQIAKFFSKNPYFWLTSAFVVAFSPVLIFLSKIPNEAIVLTFIFALLFYLLINKKNPRLIIFTMIISVLTSKQAWLTLLPFVFFTTIFYQKSDNLKGKLMQIGFSTVVVLLAFTIFLTVPQSKRSMLENNFSIFSDITIKNGIDRLRGQGMESGWPQFIDRLLFNKAHFMTTGFSHWLSNLQPGIYFGQFDKSGNLNFSQMGALNKILIIPFVLGLIYLLRKGKRKERLLIIFFLILTFPAIFIYPDFSQNLIILTLLFAAFIIAFGFMQFNRVLSLLIISAMVLELGLNLLYLAPEKKNTNFLRPHWVEAITQDVYSQSINHQTAISDDIVNDIVSFIEWYNPVDVPSGYPDVPYPYRFRQSNIGSIKIIGSDNEPYSCKEESYEKVFISSRDKDKIKDSGIKTVKTYQDSLNKEVAYLLEKGLCIR